MTNSHSRLFAGQRWAGLGLLALILLALGRYMVPAHFGSIWGDRDFTDWCVPIANRLHDGIRLYTDGMHSPMPPLPYVLPRLLFPGGGIWIQGSLLNYTFQAGMILLLFWAFSRELGPNLAFAAALAAIPVYLSMPKTMLYDSMAQFLVAATGIAAASFTRTREGAEPERNFARWPGLAVVGSLLALLILTKQNTGIGALAGVCASFLLVPQRYGFRRRCVNIVLLLLFTGAVFCIVALACHPFLSFSGLLRDVYLTGSEVKGGPTRMVKSLVIYSLQMAVMASGLYLLFCIFIACAGGRVASLRDWITGSGPNGSRQTASLPGKMNLLAPALAGFAAGFGLALLNAKTGVSLKGTIMDTAWGTLVLNAGLCLCLLLIARLLFRVTTGNGGNDSFPLATYAIVFLASAMFHNLSVARWRWSVDNNPLVFAALALVVSACATRPAKEDETAGVRGGSKRTAIVVGFIAFIMWPLANYLTLNVVASTESWPEIRHLAGAKMRPETAGMRDLVGTVRKFAAPGESVLLLPNDPNIESWFERDPPKLSCAIIFTDQYWDRYVDSDFASLQAHPPKVIVLGPRDYWRFFCRGWHVNGAAERFIDLVRERMLAKDYELKSEQPIIFQGSTDHMDVYVRKGG